MLYLKVEKQEGCWRKTSPSRLGPRACTIVLEFIGRTFQVHNGRAFIDVYVTEDMVGHKLGEFSTLHVPWSHQQEGGPEGTLIVLRG